MKAGTTAQSAATKWQQRASTAGATYVAGATAAATEQAANSIAQAQSWLDGVNQSGTAGYKKGVQAAANANKYTTKINAVGASTAGLARVTAFRSRSISIRSRSAFPICS